MFLFEPLTWYTILMWFIVLAGLMLVNELARMDKWVSLAIWMMFVMCFPAFVDTSMFAVKSSHSVAALWVVSGLALASNVAVFGYHAYRVIKYRRNPLKEEIYTDLAAYHEVAGERHLPGAGEEAMHPMTRPAHI